MLFEFHGTIRVKAFGKVDEESLVVFDSNTESIEKSAETFTQFLLLSGNWIYLKAVQSKSFV